MPFTRLIYFAISGIIPTDPYGQVPPFLISPPPYNPLHPLFIGIDARLPDGRQVTKLDFLMLDARLHRDPTNCIFQVSSFQLRVSLPASSPLTPFFWLLLQEPNLTYWQSQKNYNTYDRRRCRKRTMFFLFRDHPGYYAVIYRPYAEETSNRPQDVVYCPHVPEVEHKGDYRYDTHYIRAHITPPSDIKPVCRQAGIKN